MSDNKKERYADVPNYHKEKSRVNKEIEKLRKAKQNGGRVGGSLVDFEALKFDMEKRHILHEAYEKAKKQNREETVDRLLKSAECANYFDKNRNNIINRAITRNADAIKKTCLYLGTLATTCAMVSSTVADSDKKAIFWLGGFTALAGLSMYVHKKATQASAHDALNKLKFYVNGSKDRV